ncbi:MAG TPA: methyltransferase domain-containing protein [Cyclobacteriaceae bacterium]|nr:methyltransferase domain-containing protein [Cyclobacteriaceae bacterium]HRJ81328.1 methyltransferase domain-containing protein [Cyclobacteriaceae bacterium]
MSSKDMLLIKILKRITAEINLLRNKLMKFYRSLYANQHQLTSTTSENRYPELFEEARKALIGSAAAGINILSYGCSTGEECLSLRRYFSNSRIVGVDINRSNLQIAKSNIDDPGIEFQMSNETNIKASGPYHAIFCLSVLCRWEDTKFLQNCANVYPFSKYEATITFLANQIEKGGVLIIYNSNFRFEDTRVFGEFDIINTPSVSDSGFVVKFDSFNNRVETLHRHCIYRKKF